VVTENLTQSGYAHDPDVQLMLRVKEGDDAAFAELVSSYQDRLISIFTNMMQQGDVAEDLAQEVFMRIYRARAGYEPTAKFSTWLFRIANNLVSNTRRSKGRRKEVAITIRDSGPLGPRPQEKLFADKSALMPSRQMAKLEIQQVVREALDTLNERQRMALLLHKFEGMSYADIAETMELSTTAVKSLLSRARESLRQRLEGYAS